MFILIVFSVTLAISLCLAFSPLGDSQNSNEISAGLLSASDGNSLAEVKITADEAGKIAMPLAEQYAKENGNRTITPMVEASLSDRQKYNPDSGPVWCINVNFEYISLEVYQELGLPYWIDGYYIEVLADTGEIRSHNVQGHY